MRRAWLLLLACCIPDLEPAQLQNITCEQLACPWVLVCNKVSLRCVTAGDVTAPRLAGAEATSPTEVQIEFDEPVTLDGGTLSMSPPLQLFGLTRVDPQTFIATTAVQSAGVTYRITVAGAVDAFENVLDPAGANAEFVGAGEVPDSLPPAPLLPEADAVVSGSAVTLVWTPRQGASSYTVELAYDEMFTQLIGPAQTVTESQAVVEVAAPVAYFWRVRSNLSAPSAARRLDRVGDIIHVYCPAADDCGPQTPQAGNAARPYKSLVRALAVAQSLGVTEMRVAARGGTAFYREVFRPEGPLVIRGGFSPDFATQDPALFQTFLRFDGTSALSANAAPGAITIEDLTIEGDGLTQSAPLVCLDCDDQTTLRRLRVRTANSLAAITVRNGSAKTVGPLVEDCVLDSQQGAAIHVIAGVARVLRANVIARNGISHSGARELTIDDSDFRLVGSVARVETGSSSNLNVSVKNSRFVFPTRGDIGQCMTCAEERYENNRFLSLASVIHLDGNADSVVAFNNVFVSRSVNFSFGSFANGIAAHNTVIAPVILLYNPGGIFTNNLFATDVEESTATSDPHSFQNNFVFGHYRDENASNTTTTATLNGYDGQAMGTETSRYGGNVLSTANPATLFVDLDGADDDEETLADNDYHLVGDPDGIRAGGKSTAGNDCGTHEAPASCGNVSVDAAGVARGPSLTCGAFE